MTYNVYFYVCMQNFRLLCSSCLLLLLLLLVCYTKHLFAFSRNWMQNIVIHFFCLRNFKVAIQGYRYQSWIASVLVKLESYYKSAKQRPVSRRILVVYWLDIDVYAWQHFFTRTRLKTFFSIFLLYSPSLCDWIFKDGSTEINGNNCA